MLISPPSRNQNDFVRVTSHRNVGWSKQSTTVLVTKHFDFIIHIELKEMRCYETNKVRQRWDAWHNYLWRYRIVRMSTELDSSNCLQKHECSVHLQWCQTDDVDYSMGQARSDIHLTSLCGVLGRLDVLHWNHRLYRHYLFKYRTKNVLM